MKYLFALLLLITSLSSFAQVDTSSNMILDSTVRSGDYFFKDGFILKDTQGKVQFYSQLDKANVYMDTIIGIGLRVVDWDKPTISVVVAKQVVQVTEATAWQNYTMNVVKGYLVRGTPIITPKGEDYEWTWKPNNYFLTFFEKYE